MTPVGELYTYYEFFAGGGMARAGLGPAWKCLFANDFDHRKSLVYRINWGSNELKTADIRTLTTKVLPGIADLVWGSFPCQDLSLAGGGAGLKGERSGTFYPFWDLMRGLALEGRSPRMIVLENVCGALTSHQGADFTAICSTFEQSGYQYGAVMVDAELFVPHSRPRLFFIGVLKNTLIPGELVLNAPVSSWHPNSLRFAQAALPRKAQSAWTWWNFPTPPMRTTTLADLIEDEPSGVSWHSQEETAALLRMMSKVNLAKVEKAKELGKRVVGGIYKRTRQNENGEKVQRAEVRFDDVSGCLRTPAGGSSRQLILVVQGKKIRSRLITTRETARLMGLPDSYRLPSNYNEGYHLTGDGVAVPVVRHLAQYVFELILAQDFHNEKIAA
jgi:DNA (cytosine-5)-methyltransferase 1